MGRVLQPANSDGWRSQESNTEEIRAFQATLLMLPKNTNLGVACPEFAGASATQPPQANELIWLVYLDSSDKPVDWMALKDWCDKLSENTEFIFEPAGVNMLFKEAFSGCEAGLTPDFANNRGYPVWSDATIF